ncbi:MAG: dipeptidase [Deltaproteobacteria bacterium]|nr:dipeptidase [Deltaproteobacteria bacterium]
MSLTREPSQEAIELHRSSLVIDLHADTTMPMKWVRYRIEKSHTPGLPGKFGFFHCDIPRFREGGYKGQFLVLGTFPYPEKGCFESCLRQAALIKKRIAENSSDLQLATTAQGILEANQKGRIAILLGVEGGHNIEADLHNVQKFFDLGVGYIGLAHLTKNRICTPSGGVGADAKTPLTRFGHEVVNEMNRIGMMIDLAHVGRQSFLDAAKISDKPVIVSHTGISSVRPLWRNIDDDQIRAVAKTNGVIGIIFAWRYLCRGQRGGMNDLLQHFEHVRKLVGARHLALGSDFDGAIVPVHGLEDASKLPMLTQMFLDFGWKEEEIRSVLGENLLRVLKAHE